MQKSNTVLKKVRMSDCNIFPNEEKKKKNYNNKPTVVLGGIEGW